MPRDQIPPELRERNNWVCFKSPAEKKPLTVAGFEASSTNRSTWASFDAACEAADRLNFAGVGYVFAAEEPYCGIDLDYCHDGVGDLYPWAIFFLYALPSYAEWSPSGNGIHIIIKGKKPHGCKAVWKMEGGPKSKIEIYDFGRYFTVTGNVYEEYTPISDCQAQLNELIADLNESAPTPSSNGHSTTLMAGHSTLASHSTAVPPALKDNRYERCRAYVAAMPPAIDGSGGSIITLQVACECWRFGLDRPDAINIMDEYNTRCIGPWSEKEIDHKLNDALKKVTEAGDFGKHLRVEPEPFIELTKREPEPELVAAPILDPPGIIGDIVRWMVSTAYKPQPELALANALAWWGTVVGQRVKLKNNLRSNLYCLGLADSGAGKEHSRRCVKAMADASGSVQLLGGEDLTSDAAIYLALGTGKSLLYQIDEFGRFLSSVNHKNSSPYAAKIIDLFVRLYTEAGSYMLSKAKAEQEAYRIDEPCVSIYGSTVPEALFSTLSDADITGGFLGRMLVFSATNNDPDESEKPWIDPPANIVNLIMKWREREYKVINPKSLESNIVVIPIEDSARRVFDGFARLARTNKNKHQGRVGLQVIWSRAAALANQVALVVASGCNFDQSTVDSSIASWSVSLVERLLVSLETALADNVANSEMQRYVQRIRRIVIAGRKAGVRRNAITRSTQDIRRQMRDEAIGTLLECGEIVTKIVKTNGKDAQVFVSSRFVD